MWEEYNINRRNTVNSWFGNVYKASLSLVCKKITHKFYNDNSLALFTVVSSS